ncbi:hypothetical protein F4553_001432 [Allocatelliglobosispora scoriae]|uniref:DUF4034 domain-containing protein n=1 Tax=Allocatelliglobosispora scoriae TaxID=643052 RepID=A0A841BM54_9ACTN|nr:hypothetical protein [Allocatelliglobosispora scoriae]MBB5868053.1 hypothetical protein [Allocatelliglobosispora scoriae]
MTSKPPSEPDFTRQGASPELAPFVELSTAENHPELRARIAAIVDPHELAYMADTFITDSYGNYLLGLGDAATGLDLAFAASFRTHLAWRARTGQRAQYVTAAQWKAFREHLVLSEQALFALVAREPDNHLAWVFRLLNARGLELGQSEAQRRYAAAAKLVPHNTLAEQTYLLQLLPKWSGSWPQAHEFAQECSRSSPPGSLNSEAVATYHVERMIDADGGRQAAVLREPGVADELMAAARHSVLHPEFGRPLGWVPALSKFAMLFSVAGDYASAALFFRAMGPFGSLRVWTWISDDPAKTFVIHRDRALAKG